MRERGMGERVMGERGMGEREDIREVKIPRFRCTGTSSVILFY